MNRFKIYYWWFVSMAVFAVITTGCNSGKRQSAADNGQKIVQSTDTLAVYKAAMADSVKSEFLHAWNGYKKLAWGHDELKPISKKYHDWYGTSLYMTPVDAYDTMVLMGLKKEAEQDKKLILDNLSFNKDIYVSNFEITIRLLGGLLSAYQLDGDKRFLNLAVDLADRLMPAYHSPTGMPYRFVNLKTGKTKGAVSNPAEIGTNILEMGTLSRITGNPKYYKVAEKALVTLYGHRSKIGLVGSSINVDTGKWVSTQSHISGGIDSYYEYLLKAAILFQNKQFMTMFHQTMHAVNKYVADSTNTGLWYGHVNMYTGKMEATRFGSLDAFFPAVLALGQQMNRAKELETSCFKMWQVYGIEPEQIDYKTMKAVSFGYYLRPENLESAYYLYHYTHNPLYLKRAGIMFNSIVKYCRVPDGFTVLENVETKKKGDEMPSFLFAEVFKYAYLIFAPPKVLNFDKVVFNTEAHPLMDKVAHN